MSEQISHVDKIGRSVEQGSIVCYPIATSILGVGRVEKLSPKMITIVGLIERHRYSARKYPSEVVVISDIPETLMLLLKQQ